MEAGKCDEVGAGHMRKRFSLLHTIDSVVLSVVMQASEGQNIINTQ